MKVEIVVKNFNQNLYKFECKINKKIKRFKKECKEIKDVNILHDGETLIAIIKYI
jgi:hypothetical protein